MKRTLLAFAAVLASAAAALAASAVNRDGDPRTITVTEGGSQADITIGPGETIEFCPAGCFVTMPNGDREVLTGTETIEITGGRGRIR
ncbi:hypothetical protein [Nitratireductor thuwali]|uniref:DUF3060 domain-containing protein n=1 Tax=Nitratireductor thuwali TaxID=2267699 RepID=A0ABY5MDB8_9HYPH|nr:hypothetical protein NTH_00494 [Nitratireductor thuwali]